MNRINSLLVLSIASMLAACAPPPAPEDIVREKSHERWAAIVERDFAAAYEFSTPGYRERTPSDAYRLDMMRRPLRYESGEVLAVECEEARCVVSVLVGYRIPVGPMGIRGMGNRTEIEETWIKVDDDWWYIVE